jgi:hypothetical protein
MTTSATVLGRRLRAVLFAVCLAFPLAAEEAPKPPESQIRPPLGVVLLDEEAKFLVMDNSLEADNKVPPVLWKPGPADIDRLEKLLPEHMRQIKTPDDYQPLQEYYRQYAGVIRNGKKMIFVNFFHASYVKDWLRFAEKDPDLQKRLAENGIKEDAWLYRLMIVFDGGAYFFTIQFDVETGTFSYPRFNGYA